MADTSQSEQPSQASEPQTNGLPEGVEDDEKSKMRPADIDADMREMERRKRVEMIMNSRLFREELERIIESQLKDGNGPAGLLQQISDMMGMQGGRLQSSNVFRSASCVVPINDIRGVESMGYAKGEKILRCKLAAVYRLMDLYGWSQGVYNHITARLNQDQEHFLVNPFGMLYHEITASSLVKIDMQGNIVESGTTNFGVNVTGFLLHAAIHAARPDIKCIIHVHTPSVLAVSSLKCGLLPVCQEAVVVGEISQHPFLGGLSEPEEREKIARNLGPLNKVLFLTNHGVVCCGETVEEAFFNVYNTVLACETQIKLMPMGVDNLVLVSDEARKQIYEAARRPPDSAIKQPDPADLPPSGIKKEKQWRVGGVEFEALMRMLDNAGFRTGYIYRHPLVKGDPPRPRNDVEVPPAVSSLGYLLEEEEMYKQGHWKKYVDGRKTHDRTRWLNSPNVYQKVEILETGTPDPKKITKWVAEGSPTHSSTPVRIESALQFVPKNTDPKEFKKLQQQIKDNRRSDKITSGPQSHILEGVSWEEAKKLQDANISATGDQVILVGAASKGIIQRGFQHNALVYKTPYAKNPFDTITDEELEEYKKVVERKQRGESFDEEQSESEPLSSSLHNSRPTNEESVSAAKSPLLSPTSAASETEEESRDEPRVLRIETKQVPRPSQAEVVLSDAEGDLPDPGVERTMSLRYPPKAPDSPADSEQFKRTWSLPPDQLKKKDNYGKIARDKCGCQKKCQLHQGLQTNALKHNLARFSCNNFVKGHNNPSICFPPIGTLPHFTQHDCLTRYTSLSSLSSLVSGCNFTKKKCPGSIIGCHITRYANIPHLQREEFVESLWPSQTKKLSVKSLQKSSMNLRSGDTEDISHLLVGPLKSICTNSYLTTFMQQHSSWTRDILLSSAHSVQNYPKILSPNYGVSNGISKTGICKPKYEQPQLSKRISEDKNEIGICKNVMQEVEKEVFCLEKNRNDNMNPNVLQEESLNFKNSFSAFVVNSDYKSERENVETVIISNVNDASNSNVSEENIRSSVTDVNAKFVLHPCSKEEKISNSTPNLINTVQNIYSDECADVLLITENTIHNPAEFHKHLSSFTGGNNAEDTKMHITCNNCEDTCTSVSSNVTRDVFHVINNEKESSIETSVEVCNSTEWKKANYDKNNQNVIVAVVPLKQQVVESCVNTSPKITKMFIDQVEEMSRNDHFIDDAINFNITSNGENRIAVFHESPKFENSDGSITVDHVYLEDHNDEFLKFCNMFEETNRIDNKSKKPNDCFDVDQRDSSSNLKDNMYAAIHSVNLKVDSSVVCAEVSSDIEGKISNDLSGNCITICDNTVDTYLVDQFSEIGQIFNGSSICNRHERISITNANSEDNHQCVFQEFCNMFDVNNSIDNEHDALVSSSDDMCEDFQMPAITTPSNALDERNCISRCEEDSHNVGGEQLSEGIVSFNRFEKEEPFYNKLDLHTYLNSHNQEKNDEDVFVEICYLQADDKSGYRDHNGNLSVMAHKLGHNQQNFTTFPNINDRLNTSGLENVVAAFANKPENFQQISFANCKEFTKENSLDRECSTCLELNCEAEGSGQLKTLGEKIHNVAQSNLQDPLRPLTDVCHLFNDNGSIYDKANKCSTGNECMQDDKLYEFTDFCSVTKVNDSIHSSHDECFLVNWSGLVDRSSRIVSSEAYCMSDEDFIQNIKKYNNTANKLMETNQIGSFVNVDGIVQEMNSVESDNCNYGVKNDNLEDQWKTGNTSKNFSGIVKIFTEVSNEAYENNVSDKLVNILDNGSSLYNNICSVSEECVKESILSEEKEEMQEQCNIEKLCNTENDLHICKAQAVKIRENGKISTKPKIIPVRLPQQSLNLVKLHNFPMYYPDTCIAKLRFIVLQELYRCPTTSAYNMLHTLNSTNYKFAHLFSTEITSRFSDSSINFVHKKSTSDIFPWERGKALLPYKRGIFEKIIFNYEVSEAMNFMNGLHNKSEGRFMKKERSSKTLNGFRYNYGVLVQNSILCNTKRRPNILDVKLLQSQQWHHNGNVSKSLSLAVPSLDRGLISDFNFWNTLLMFENYFNKNLYPMNKESFSKVEHEGKDVVIISGFTHASVTETTDMQENVLGTIVKSDDNWSGSSFSSSFNSSCTFSTTEHPDLSLSASSLDIVTALTEGPPSVDNHSLDYYSFSSPILDMEDPEFSMSDIPESYTTNAMNESGSLNLSSDLSFTTQDMEESPTASHQHSLNSQKSELGLSPYLKICFGSSESLACSNSPENNKCNSCSAYGSVSPHTFTRHTSLSPDNVFSSDSYPKSSPCSSCSTCQELMTNWESARHYCDDSVNFHQSKIENHHRSISTDISKGFSYIPTESLFNTSCGSPIMSSDVLKDSECEETAECKFSVSFTDTLQNNEGEHSILSSGHNSLQMVVDTSTDQDECQLLSIHDCVVGYRPHVKKSKLRHQNIHGNPLDVTKQNNESEEISATQKQSRLNFSPKKIDRNMMKDRDQENNDYWSNKKPFSKQKDKSWERVTLDCQLTVKSHSCQDVSLGEKIDKDMLYYDNEFSKSGNELLTTTYKSSNKALFAWSRARSRSCQNLLYHQKIKDDLGTKQKKNRRRRTIDTFFIDGEHIFAVMTPENGLSPEKRLANDVRMPKILSDTSDSEFYLVSPHADVNNSNFTEYINSLDYSPVTLPSGYSSDISSLSSLPNDRVPLSDLDSPIVPGQETSASAASVHCHQMHQEHY